MPVCLIFYMSNEGNYTITTFKIKEDVLEEFSYIVKKVNRKKTGPQKKTRNEVVEDLMKNYVKNNK